MIEIKKLPVASLRKLQILFGLFYLLYCFYIANFAGFMPDAFVGANHDVNLLKLTPYLDYAPFRNLLANYILALPSLISKGWEYLNWVRFIVTVSHLGCAFFLYKTLKNIEVVNSKNWLTFFILLLSPSVLETFFYLRIDLLTNFFFLMGVFFFYRKNSYSREILCPILFANSLLCSQKIVVLMIPFSVIWFFEEIIENKKGIKYFLRSILIFFIPILLYLFFWSLQASFDTVFKAFLLKTSRIKIMLDLYAKEDPLIWWDLIKKNFLLFTIGIFGFASLLVNVFKNKKHVHLLIATLVFILGQIKYPVVYNYNMNKVLPVVYLLALYFFWNHNKHDFSKYFNIFALVVILLQFTLVSFSAHTGKEQQAKDYRMAQEIYKKYPDSYHLSGFYLMFPKELTPHYMGWIDRFRVAELITLSRNETNQFIQELLDHKIVFFVQSVTTNWIRLNPYFREFLTHNFRHFSGSIFTYSIKLLSNQNQVMIPITGNYQILARTGKNVEINGHSYKDRDFITLNAGLLNYSFEEAQHIRLHLHPVSKEDFAEIVQPPKNFFKPIWDPRAH